jgi:hypothetical protein
MSSPIPQIGDWYVNDEGVNLEVVAIDPQEGTVEVQFFDGTVEEYDAETWRDLNFMPGEPPEDWSGSLDLSRDDYGVDLDQPAGRVQGNPLDDLDQADRDLGLE